MDDFLLMWGNFLLGFWRGLTNVLSIHLVRLYLACAVFICMVMLLPQPWLSIGMIATGGIGLGVTLRRRHNTPKLPKVDRARIDVLEAELRTWEDWDVEAEVARRERQADYYQRIADNIKIIATAGKISISPPKDPRMDDEELATRRILLYNQREYTS